MVKSSNAMGKYSSSSIFKFKTMKTEKRYIENYLFKRNVSYSCNLLQKEFQESWMKIVEQIALLETEF